MACVRIASSKEMGVLGRMMAHLEDTRSGRACPQGEKMVKSYVRRNASVNIAVFLPDDFAFPNRDSSRAIVVQCPVVERGETRYVLGLKVKGCGTCARCP